LLERERDLRFVRRDECVHYPLYVAALQEMDLQLVDRHLEPSLPRGDQRVDDRRRAHLPEAHPEQGEERDVNPGRERPDPQTDRDEPQKYGDHDDREKDEREDQTRAYRRVVVHVPAPFGSSPAARTTWR